MQDIIKEIYNNFDGKTLKERKNAQRRKCSLSQIIDNEICKIFAAQAKNKMEVHNGKAA